MKKVLIIEPVLTGHHYNYLLNIAKGLNGGDIKLTILTRSGIVVDGFRNELGSDIDINVVEYSRFDRLSSSVESYWRILLRYFEFYYFYRAAFLCYVKEGFDLVFLPYGDTILYFAALFGSPFARTPWAVITMRSSFHWSMSRGNFKSKFTNFLKLALFKRFLKCKTLTNVYSIDPLLIEFSQRNINSDFHRKLRYLADPVEDIKLLSREKSRLDLNESVTDSDFLILVYGALAMRKGIAKLLNFLVNPLCDKNIKLVLVGVPDTEFLQFTENSEYVALRKSGRILEFFGRASIDFQDIVFSASDASWVGYEGHLGMSGVLLLAEKYGVPSLVSPDGLMGWFNSQYGFGASVDHLLNEDFCSVFSIKELLNAQRFQNRSERRNLIESHSWSKFVNVVKADISKV
ncbi:hypothetical protein [Curvibacter lanceolatus]|uniref:hypothetical protein n=1 Tax=Curvibacter lanceolatus TaxID=86182 RepID=UPI0012FC322D|nr:hypothetical protein [Curvibacter lanceolatus]